MPTVAEALAFVRSPGTSDAQLRRACGILHLADGGSTDDVRARLLEVLGTMQTGEFVVCLNPRLIHPDR
ncbi:MAG: hypothetical protein R2745_24570 [Vicinamibacterales bacterium]